MIEALNKIAELAAEGGKAQLILESKDQQIEQMQKHIDAQQAQINELNSMNAAMNQQLSEITQ
jgi:peptidoglycan hydrolase CwlO-like protein